jgi:hypothetical protein
MDRGTSPTEARARTGCPDPGRAGDRGAVPVGQALDRRLGRQDPVESPVLTGRGDRPVGGTRPRRRGRGISRAAGRFRPELLEDRTMLAAALSVGANVDINSKLISDRAGSEYEGTIAIDPTNPLHLFAASNIPSRGLFASVSTDGGATWTPRIMTNGDGLLTALSDPQATFDQFGNLFLTYITRRRPAPGVNQSVAVVMSTDGGQTFTRLGVVDTDPANGDNIDQPSIATGPGDVAGAGSVWVFWGDHSGSTLSARGARVTGLGAVNPFGATQVLPMSAGGNFGDIKVGPSGQVLTTYQSRVSRANGTGTSTGGNNATTLNDTSVARVANPFTGVGNIGDTLIITGGTGGGQRRRITARTATQLTVATPWTTIPDATSTYEIVSPTTIYTDLDPGLGMPFANPVAVTTTNVDSPYAVPAQSFPPNHELDAEANLAWDRSGGPNNGQIYLVYTNAPEVGSPDTNIFVRTSNDNGQLWSPPKQVNEPNANSQFSPAIALDQVTGAVAVTWFDARNDNGAGSPGDTDRFPNDEAQIYGTASVDGGVNYLPNVPIGAMTSNQNTANIFFGDYTSVAFDNGTLYPVWADNSAGLNPFQPKTRANGTGTSTGGNNATTLNDTSAARVAHPFTASVSVGDTVLITGGTGAGQSRRITARTATRLTIDANIPWTTVPDATSTYRILAPTRFDMATARVTVLQPSPLTDFFGLQRNQPQVNGPEPPDTQVAAGPTKVMEVVNYGLAVFEKNTGFDQLSTQSLANFFAPLRPASLFDPALTFDEGIDNGRDQNDNRNPAGRFILAAADVDAANQKSYIDIAVSNTADPMDGFTEMHRIDISEKVFGLLNLWGSYTRIGWNADAVVVTVNMNLFPFAEGDGGGFDHVQIVSMTLNLLTDANNATFDTHRYDSSSYPALFGIGSFSLVPATMHGAAANGPMWFAQEGPSFPLNSIRLTRVDNILAPALTGTSTIVLVSSYRSLRPKRQPGPGGTFDPNADTRILNVSVRGNRLVAAQTVGTGSIFSPGPDHARWYDFNIGANPPTLNQSGDIDRGPSVDTYYPSIEIATNGDLGLTFMESSPSEFISMYVTGRTAADPRGRMEAARLVRAGVGSYLGTRAGDYSGIAVDPVKGTTFWAANEYIPIANRAVWGTAIAQFTFQTPTPLPLTPIDNATWSYGDIGAGWTTIPVGYLGSARASRKSPTDVATWYFFRLPGTYEVFITWPVLFNRGVVQNSPVAQYNVFDGPNLLATILVNQSLAPDGVVVRGSQWKYLGTFTTKTALLRVELRGDANFTVVADAVFLADPPAPPSSTEVGKVVSSLSPIPGQGDESSRKPDAPASPIGPGPTALPDATHRVLAPRIDPGSPSSPPAVQAVDGLLALNDQEDFWSTPIGPIKSRGSDRSVPGRSDAAVKAKESPRTGPGRNTSRLGPHRRAFGTRLLARSAAPGAQPDHRPERGPGYHVRVEAPAAVDGRGEEPPFAAVLAGPA